MVAILKIGVCVLELVVLTEVMINSMRIVVLGVHSFTTPHYKTGIQHIACGLAERGVEVDYISVPSSPFDLIDAERRKRFRRVWWDFGKVPVAQPVPNLREYSFPSLVPVHKLFIPGQFMLGAVQALVSVWFRTKTYDLCIHDVGPTMTYLPLVKAKRHVLRLNDNPHGFPDMPAPLVWALENRLKANFYDQVWAVSQPLAEFVQEMEVETTTLCIPNGFDAVLFDVKIAQNSSSAMRAVYVGGNSPWLDIDLIRDVAKLLPDWEFHFVGAGFDRESDASNVRFLPPVNHERVPALLAEYNVGLLPYTDDTRMRCVQRPLKFYEYYAAGLGIACAAVGGLRDGLGGMACFGRDVQGFASAVTQSVAAAAKVSSDERQRFIVENDWSVRCDEVWDAIKGL